VGDQVCACRVEPAVSRAYMIRAAERLQRGKFVGMAPRRRCLVCFRGDHDLVDTMPVAIALPTARLREQCGCLVYVGDRSAKTSREQNEPTPLRQPPGRRGGRPQVSSSQKHCDSVAGESVWAHLSDLKGFALLRAGRKPGAAT
jgi:hypothetical protein